MKKFRLSFFMPLLLCLMLAACGSNSSTTTPSSTPATMGTQEVKVTVGDFYIRSPLTTFTTGTHYHFIVTNTGMYSHDFLIMHPMATQTMVMDDVYKHALTYLNNIAPKETKTLDFTFDHTAPQGVLELACHYGGHYEAGMHQSIVVNAPQGSSVAAYPNNAIPLDADASTGSGTSMGGKCDQPVTATIASNAFTPTSLSLKMGDTLTVMNKGSDSYTLTTTPDAGIRFTTVDAGETEYVLFPKAGTFTLSTQEHPEAKATVTVSATEGATCGAEPVATVSFDANYRSPTVPYFFTPTQVTIKAGQSITLSNLSDHDLTFTSTPDAGVGSIQLDRNEHQVLPFKTNGTYVVSCKEFPTQKFTVVVQGTASGDNS